MGQQGGLVAGTEWARGERKAESERSGGKTVKASEIQ